MVAALRLALGGELRVDLVESGYGRKWRSILRPLGVGADVFKHLFLLQAELLGAPEEVPHLEPALRLEREKMASIALSREQP